MTDVRTHAQVPIVSDEEIRRLIRGDLGLDRPMPWVPRPYDIGFAFTLGAALGWAACDLARVLLG